MTDPRSIATASPHSPAAASSGAALMHYSPSLDQVRLDGVLSQDHEVEAAVPAAKIRALLEASDSMMRSIFLHDYQSMLETVVLHAHDLFEAESCAVLLAANESDPPFQLAARYSDHCGHELVGDSCPLLSNTTINLPKHLSGSGSHVNLGPDGLDQEDYFRLRQWQHLESERCRSFLGVPLKDRKGRLLGAIEVENKQNTVRHKPQEESPQENESQGGAGVDPVGFDDVDLCLAQILANKIVIALENYRTSQSLHSIIQGINQATKVDEILEEILGAGIKLLRADLGDLALWNASKKQLVNWCKRGKGGLEPKNTLPDNSMMCEVWEKGGTINCPDVTVAERYLSADPNVKSELAIRLEWEGRPIGVVNAESFQPDYFDQQDCELIEIVAKYASAAIQFVGKQNHFGSIVEHLMAEERHPQRETLTRILLSVRDIYGFDAGVIYIPNYVQGCLCCAAQMGVEDLSSEADSLCFAFGEPSLASKIFVTREGFYSANPLEDEAINAKGRRLFQLDQPLVGVPLIDGEKVVGVLVVWNRKSPPIARPDHVFELQTIARLAALSVAVTESDRKWLEVLIEVQSVLSQMQSEPSLAKNLGTIMGAVQIAGFDRVAVFRYQEETRQLLGLDSLGIEEPQELRNYSIAVDDDPYLRALLEGNLSNTMARKHEPDAPESLGPDPQAAILGRDSSMPWAVVPLIIAGQAKLYGTIVADNAILGRPITSDALDYLSLLGGIAAQAVSNAEMLDVERARAAMETRSQLIRCIIHNFHSPSLGARQFVLSLEKLLKSQTPVSDEAVNLLDHIHGYLDRTGKTVDYMQRWALPFEQRCEPTAISKSIEEAVTGAKLNPRCTVGFEFVADLGLVFLDKVRFEEALAQIAVNAWEEMGGDGSITVRVYTSSPAESPALQTQLKLAKLEREDMYEPFVMISMADSGRGIADEVRTNLFRPGVTTKGEGSYRIGKGLGLFFVGMTVAEHRGAVWAEDGPDGVGTVFTVAVPLRSSTT